jgi:DNA-directed RNA polymerase specialized sigma24 family protein
MTLLKTSKPRRGGSKQGAVNPGEAAQLKYLQRQQRRLESDLEDVRQALGMAVLRLHQEGNGYAAIGRHLGLGRNRVMNIANRARERETSKRLKEAAARLPSS